MATAQYIVFLDIEASGLGPESFPIEVGWAFLGGVSGASLVKPASSWRQAAWDEQAELLHGISWGELLLEGKLAWDVAAELNHLLSGEGILVLSDAPPMDSFWLDRLFEEYPGQRTFDLSDFKGARGSIGSEFSIDHDHDQQGGPGRVHRAEADALMMRDTWVAARRDASRQL